MIKTPRATPITTTTLAPGASATSNQRTRAPLPARNRHTLALGLAAMLAAGALWAEADGPDYYAVRGVAQGGALNIRAEPSARAKRVGSIPPDGTCIRNRGCRGGLTFEEFSTLTPTQQERRTRENPRWCKVEFGGVAGWVAGRYLAEADCRR